MESATNLTGPRIREVREAKNLSPTELAASCTDKEFSLSADDIENIENQKRSVSDFELIALAKALGVTGTSLLFDKGNSPEKSS